MIGGFNLRRIPAIIITFLVVRVMNISIIAIKMQVLIAVNRRKRSFWLSSNVGTSKYVGSS